ncbi:MAG: hypothetical protein EBU90_08880 [Proteobacteria bacterium]|nr:hypothetical protein [Pseudomonadota bacterium]NBP13613.1 hypothetical protein [bacterium]
MIYTTVVLFLGIYLGQEYTIIPRISVLVISTLNYLKKIQQEQEQEQEQRQSEYLTTSYYTQFVNRIIESWFTIHTKKD